MARDVAWQFETARFRVALEIEPEDTDPADSFDFEDDIDAVRSGAVEWFAALVVVYLKDDSNGWRRERELGVDALGGCAYESVREFYTAHRDADPMNRNCSMMRAANGGNVSMCHYFPDMVREAISEARKVLCNTPRVRCEPVS